MENQKREVLAKIAEITEKIECSECPFQKPCWDIPEHIYNCEGGLLILFTNSEGDFPAVTKIPYYDN